MTMKDIRKYAIPPVSNPSENEYTPIPSENKRRKTMEKIDGTDDNTVELSFLPLICR